MRKILLAIAFVFIVWGSFAQKGEDWVIYRTSDSANSYTLKFSNEYKNATELIVQARRSRRQNRYIVNTVRSSPYQLVMVPEIDSARKENLIFILAVPDIHKKFLADEIQGEFVSESTQRSVVFRIKGFKFRKPPEDLSKK